ncbi:MAG TPA: alpha/beta hydrolase-fold protein [Anaeromyxobacter sp.]
MAVLRRVPLRSLIPAAALACAPPARAPPLGGSPRLPAGETRLGLAEERDALAYVPPLLHPAKATPLVVFLHGAGGDARRTMPALRELADAYGFVVLAPESRGYTWDLLLGDVGPDLDFLQRALDAVKARVRVDREHVALAGFSDGASYALTVGLRNRDVFSHVIAFSPGFAGPSRAPQPVVFVSHGTQDAVLPVDASRAIVARLTGEGCTVTYREFEGGHAVPADVTRDAIRWFLGR